MRKPYEAKAFSCFSRIRGKTKRQTGIEKGNKEIERELDIANFLKHQKYLRILMSILFTKTEQYLIRKNKRFVISTSKKAITSSSDEEFPPS